jgi:Bacterial regulatory protein, arsR family
MKVTYCATTKANLLDYKVGTQAFEILQSLLNAPQTVEHLGNTLGIRLSNIQFHLSKMKTSGIVKTVKDYGEDPDIYVFKKCVNPGCNWPQREIKPTIPAIIAQYCKECLKPRTLKEVLFRIQQEGDFLHEPKDVQQEIKELKQIQEKEELRRKRNCILEASHPGKKDLPTRSNYDGLPTENMPGLSKDWYCLSSNKPGPPSKMGCETLDWREQD